MSEKVPRIAVVCEGDTDFVFIDAVLERHFEDYVPEMIQPERSEYTQGEGLFGGGWKGVRRWCREVGVQLALLNADVVILHLDADVADDPEVNCAKPCPPPEATADALHHHILGWLGKKSVPDEVLFCIPSKCTEAWVLAAMFPQHRFVSDINKPLECRKNPDKQLRVLPKNQRLAKTKRDYQRHRATFTEKWPQVVQCCKQAQRFDDALSSAKKF